MRGCNRNVEELCAGFAVDHDVSHGVDGDDVAAGGVEFHGGGVARLARDGVGEFAGAVRGSEVERLERGFDVGGEVLADIGPLGDVGGGGRLVGALDRGDATGARAGLLGGLDDVRGEADDGADERQHDEEEQGDRLAQVFHMVLAVLVQLRRATAYIRWEGQMSHVRCE